MVYSVQTVHYVKCTVYMLYTVYIEVLSSDQDPADYRLQGPAKLAGRENLHELNLLLKYVSSFFQKTFIKMIVKNLVLFTPSCCFNVKRVEG